MAAAVASSDEALCLLSAKKKITLVSSDGQSFEVEEADAVKSLTVKQVIEDKKIPLPVTGKILSKVIDYCKHQLGADDEEFKSLVDADFVKVDQDTLSSLRQAAKFLKIQKIQSLLDLQSVGDMRKSVKQYKVHCPDEHSKRDVVLSLHKILKILGLQDKVTQTIVFVQTSCSAFELQNALISMHYKVGNTHTARTSEDRNKILNDFKEVETHVLISTDKDLTGFYQKVNLVVNYDLPVNVKPDGSSEPEYGVYVQRVDRAGSFGCTSGAVINLLFSGGSDDQIMNKIESHLTTSQITEVSPWDDDEKFEFALATAGLLPY